MLSLGSHSIIIFITYVNYAGINLASSPGKGALRGRGSPRVALGDATVGVGKGRMPPGGVSRVSAKVPSCSAIKH